METYRNKASFVKRYAVEQRRRLAGLVQSRFTKRDLAEGFMGRFEDCERKIFFLEEAMDAGNFSEDGLQGLALILEDLWQEMRKTSDEMCEMEGKADRIIDVGSGLIPWAGKEVSQ